MRTGWTGTLDQLSAHVAQLTKASIHERTRREANLLELSARSPRRRH